MRYVYTQGSFGSKLRRAVHMPGSLQVTFLNQPLWLANSTNVYKVGGILTSLFEWRKAAQCSLALGCSLYVSGCQEATVLRLGCQAFQTCYLVSVIFTRFSLHLEMSWGVCGCWEGSSVCRGLPEWPGSWGDEQRSAGNKPFCWESRKK